MMLQLLTILFIGLKLTGYIDWSWFLVVLPLTIKVLFSVIVVVFRLDKTQAQKDAEDAQRLIRKWKK